MRIILITAVIFIFSHQAAFSEIYKCKGINGQLHFSDDMSKISALCVDEKKSENDTASQIIKTNNTDCYLDLKVGRGWKFTDEKEHLLIIASKIVKLKGTEYFLVEWSRAGFGVYQSEYWLEQNNDIYVAGRNVFGTDIFFDKPYLLIKHDAEVGMKWSDKITTKGINDEMHTTVEKRENINTPLGKVDALKVVTIVKGVKLERWYGKNVGLVKTISYARLGDEFVKMSENNLLELIDEDSLPRIKSESKIPITTENISSKWFFYDFISKRPNILVWNLMANGTFDGECRDSEPFWNFKGNWWLKDNKLSSTITWSSLKMKNMDGPDTDEIIELTNEYMVINCVHDGGGVRTFWRNSNDVLEMQLMLKIIQAQANQRK